MNLIIHRLFFKFNELDESLVKLSLHEKNLNKKNY